VTLNTPTWGQFVVTGLLTAGGKTPVPPVGKHGASQLYWGGLQLSSAGTRGANASFLPGSSLKHI